MSKHVEDFTTERNKGQQVQNNIHSKMDWMHDLRDPYKTRVGTRATSHYDHAQQCTASRHVFHHLIPAIIYTTRCITVLPNRHGSGDWLSSAHDFKGYHRQMPGDSVRLRASISSYLEAYTKPHNCKTKERLNIRRPNKVKFMNNAGSNKKNYKN